MEYLDDARTISPDNQKFSDAIGISLVQDPLAPAASGGDLAPFVFGRAIEYWCLFLLGILAIYVVFGTAMSGQIGYPLLVFVLMAFCPMFVSMAWTRANRPPQIVTASDLSIIPEDDDRPIVIQGNRKAVALLCNAMLMHRSGQTTATHLYGPRVTYYFLIGVVMPAALILFREFLILAVPIPFIIFHTAVWWFFPRTLSFDHGCIVLSHHHRLARTRRELMIVSLENARTLVDLTSSTWIVHPREGGTLTISLNSLFGGWSLCSTALGWIQENADRNNNYKVQG